MKIYKTDISEYDYVLPENRIAKYPLENRDKSKLLIYNKGEMFHKDFFRLPDVLDRNDLLIFNTTKVISARLLFQKSTGANIEIFCLEPKEPSSYEQIFGERESCKWICAVGNSKKWKKGVLSLKIGQGEDTFLLNAEREGKDTVNFFWNNRKVTFADILESAGKIPIPPYLKRDSEESDKIRYQTVYSKQKGSVAAPTAGLHFTKELMQELKKKGIKTSELVLHVGAGTFKPVKGNSVKEHEMHTEHFTVSRQLTEDLLINENVVSVGTTSIRTLESLYWLGVKLEKNPGIDNLHLSQWEAYGMTENLSKEKALENILDYMKKQKTDIINASTQIIIVPGYDFKITKKLITNFHQPKSTLLLLVSAFIGEDRKKVYDYALKNDFRFLSYGDSSLLIP